MRLTIASGRRFASLASFVAPVVVLALAKLAGLGPIASRATPIDSADEGPANPSTDQVPVAAPEPPLHVAPDSGASLARSRDLCRRAAESLASPFYQNTVSAPEPAVASTPAGPAPPIFVLSGVMLGRPPIAVIDGEIHRPGDDLGDGWSIESIDGRKLIVMLRHVDGRVHRLNAVQP